MLERTLSLIGFAFLLAGCQGTPKDALVPPQPTLAPYTGAREVTWAVVPPRNDSGASEVDTLAVGDALVAAAEQVRGVRCLPLNRTIEALRGLKMEAPQSAADARRLAQAMRVDAVLISTITAWDSYKPEIGIAAALFARPGALEVSPAATASSRDIQTSTTESSASFAASDAPLAMTSEHFDARNHQVLADLQTYATGRLKGPTALGWRSYASTSKRFTEFATYRTIQVLVQQEAMRVSASQTQVGTKPDNSIRGRTATNQVLAGQVDTIQTEK
ncbi:MAG: hypothetical protein JNK25_01970 [Phycisphaerae bacterium]|nr:hypothetical protein [Phycisphaerae bacterium]